jgi:hypothetical protein
MVIGRSLATSDLLSIEGITLSSRSMTTSTPPSIDDPDAIAATIREATERAEKALRERPVPIAIEPPTVFRP